MNVHRIPEFPGRGRLGRHVEHDARSRAYEVTLPRVQLRSVTHVRHVPVFDQGNLGSCTGNAMAGACMTGPLYVEGQKLLTEDDAVMLYTRATHLDKIPGHMPEEDTGSSGLAVAKAAQERGLIAHYRHAFSRNSALAALCTGPVIIGIDWYEGFDIPNGSHAELVIRGGVRGGHEVVLDAIDAEAKYVGGANSWGASWGAAGRFCMTWETLGTLLAHDGDCVVPYR